MLIGVYPDFQGQDDDDDDEEAAACAHLATHGYAVRHNKAKVHVLLGANADALLVTLAALHGALKLVAEKEARPAASPKVLAAEQHETLRKLAAQVVDELVRLGWETASAPALLLDQGYRVGVSE